MIKKLRDFIILNEGFKLKPYRCTAGKMTIGVGYNYEDRGFTTEVLTAILNEGFTEALAYSLLEDDMDMCISALRDTYVWYSQLDEVRMIAVTDMFYNLGADRFSRFKKMIKAFEERNYQEAANQAIDSAWYHQVGDRSKRIVYMIRTGKWGE